MRSRRWLVLVLLLPIAALSSLAAQTDPVVTACATDTQTGAGTNLAQALAAGGTIRFACPAGTSIGVSGRYTLRAGVTIDGGDAVTLDGRGSAGPFLTANGKVVLQRIVVRGFVQPPIGRPPVVRPPAKPLGATRRHAVLEAQADTVLDHVTIEANEWPVRIRGAAIVTDSTFAANGGQALDIDGVAQISRSRFTGNGIALELHAGWVRHSTFDRHTTTAVRVTAPVGTVEIQHSVFTENRGGPALLLSQQSGRSGSGKVSVRANTFRDNDGGAGGGALAVFDMVQEARALGRPAVIVNAYTQLPPAGFATAYNRFESNRGGRGGAIDADLAKTRGLVSTADIFIRNTASGDGGAVSVTRGQMQITHALFTGNQAAGRGAALIAGDQARVTIGNSLVVRQTGPAAALAGGALTLTNVTVADNDSPGLVLADAAGRVSNSIVARNRSGDCGRVHAAAFRGKNAASDGSCPGMPASDVALDAFYVPASGSLALRAGDAALCRAAPVGGVDLAFQRRSGTACTLGAFERAPVRQFARAVDRRERHATDSDDFDDDDGYEPPPRRRVPKDRPDPDDILDDLRDLGIDISVKKEDMLDWLDNPRYTPYPSIASAIFQLLDGKRLRRRVFLDVIVWNYEHTPGIPSPRHPSAVDARLLKAAILEGFNGRHGTAEREFQGIVR